MDLFTDIHQAHAGYDDGYGSDMQHDSVVQDTIDYYDNGHGVYESGDAYDHGSLSDDYTDGNSSLILSHQDPLMHAHEYQMHSFEAGEPVQAGDALHGMHDGNAMDGGLYTMDMHNHLMPNWNNIEDLPGVENGMLVDSSHLGNIVALGEVQGTEHIDSSHIERSEAVKAEFLAMHGYDSVPQGYEVHHIVPLSEGGADDVHNMILLSEHDHDIVTHAHKEFYGWDTPW